MKCDFCGQDIHEGQHYFTQTIELATLMPDGYVPARAVEPTVLEGVFDTPSCAARWLIASPILQNVFAH